MVMGLGQGFAPSFEAAAKALTKNTLTKRTVSSGPEIALESLAEVTDRVREGREDVQLRGWAGRALAKAGKPTTRTAQAQAVLDALHAQTQYVPDPVNTELIAKPHVTLCLDGAGLCMPIGDCDDLVVAFASACGSLGIPVKVVGQAFKTSMPTHVIAAIEDEYGSWVRVDPSVAKYRVGEFVPATQEWWLDPNVPSKAAIASGKAPPPGTASFIGVGSSNVGLADGPTVTDITGAAARAVEERVKTALDALTRARNDLSAALDTIWKVRSQTRGPQNLFDPEPGYAITSVANFPAAAIWTPTMDAIASQTYDIATRLINMAHAALDGTRRILVDASTNDLLIEVLQNDPWGIHIVVETAEKIIFGFFSTDGTLLSGMDNQGNALSATAVQAAIAAQPSIAGGGTGTSGVPVGVGVPQAVLVAGIVSLGLLAVTIGVYFTMTAVSQASTNAAREATTQELTKCIAAGKCPPEVIKAVNDARLYQTQADTASAKAANPLGDVANTLKWAAIGGIAVTGVVLLFPIVQEAIAGAVASRRAARLRGGNS